MAKPTSVKEYSEQSSAGLSDQQIERLLAQAGQKLDERRHRHGAKFLKVELVVKVWEDSQPQNLTPRTSAPSPTSTSTEPSAAPSHGRASRKKQE